MKKYLIEIGGWNVDVVWVIFIVGFRGLVYIWNSNFGFVIIMVIGCLNSV